MVLDNNLKIYSKNIYLISYLTSIIIILNDILEKISFTNFDNTSITNLKKIYDEMLELLKSYNNDGLIIFVTQVNDPILNNYNYIKFNIKPYTLYFLLNINFNNTGLLIQLLSLIPNTIVSNNLLLVYSIDLQIFLNGIDTIISEKPIDLISFIKDIENTKEKIFISQIVLKNIEKYIFEIQYNPVFNQLNTQTNTQTNTQNNIQGQYQILQINNINLINNYFTIVNILNDNLEILMKIFNMISINEINSYDNMISINEINSYDKMLNLKINLTNILKNYSNLKYIKYYFNLSELTSDSISSITLINFNMQLNIIYFYLNINPANTKVINNILSINSNIILNGNYLLIYKIDLNSLFNTLDFLIINKPIKIIEYIDILYNYYDIFKEFKTLLFNVQNYGLELQFINNSLSIPISNIPSTIPSTTPSITPSFNNSSTTIINSQSITDLIELGLQNKKYNQLTIKDKLYLKLFILINKNLYKCLSFTKFKTSNFITDFLNYNNINNINYNLLPNKFIYDNTNEYYRENNILYLKINSNIYFRKKNINYILSNGLIKIDNSNTFKTIYEEYFSTTNIYKLLIEIKNLLNEIFDNKLIVYKFNKIYFHKLNKNYNLLCDDDKKILLQIIDISYFYSINDNWIELKDIWEIYYLSLQNSLLDQKIILLIESIEKILQKIIS